MAQAQLAHTADLDGGTLRAVRNLLDRVFAGEFDDHDWEHSLGGMHVLLRDGTELVGHASLIQRRLLHGGRALRTGYVESLGVLGSRRGRGFGAALMAELERLIRGGYELGALSTTEQAAGFYAARGWRLWQGRSGALTPSGVVATPDEDGGVYVLPGAVPLDLTGELICDWRDGDVW